MCWGAARLGLSARYYADCRMRYLLAALTFLLAPAASQDFARPRERMVREQIDITPRRSRPRIEVVEARRAGGCHARRTILLTNLP